MPREFAHVSVFKPILYRTTEFLNFYGNNINKIKTEKSILSFSTKCYC